MSTSVTSLAMEPARTTLTNSVRATFAFGAAIAAEGRGTIAPVIKSGTKLTHQDAQVRIACALGTTAATLYSDAERILLLVGSAGRTDWAEMRYASRLASELSSDPGNALRSLRGPWVLLFVDKHRDRCIVSTDRAARRAPCFVACAGRLVFGLSALDVVAEEPELRTLRSQALFDYLYTHVIPSPETAFEGVQRLRPGEFVQVDGTGVTRELYWRPDYHEAVRSRDFASARATFKELLESSVASELGGGPVGSFLSGGTDSSTIAGMLGKVTGQAACTYSIGFDAPGFDEMDYARIASRHFRTRHHEYYITPDDLVASIPAVARAYDQPFGNSSALPAFYCARLAKADGVTRLLGGDGGDEIFGGNTRYAYQKVLDIYSQIASGPVDRAARALLLRPAITARLPGVRKVRSYVEKAIRPMPSRLHAYNLIDRIGVDRILTPALLNAIDTAAPAHEEEAYYASCSDLDLVNRMLHLDWKYTLADNDLPKVVGTCDLAGIGVGFPMLDEALVDFANALPAGWKVKGLRLRHFFKRALSDFLPQEILAKKKHGFGLPFGIWLVRHQGLQRLAFGALESLVARGIVRREFVSDTLRPSLTEHASYYGELAWILMMLEYWLQHHQPAFSVAH